ncbi:MAG: hypothetical protein CFE37_13140 [Alphaproteobacteria bacterium PA4]|nr:MAG: hypothetical protein CFE37_13140 [Alphaproteobacteria bacterium PA4]
MPKTMWLAGTMLALALTQALPVAAQAPAPKAATPDKKSDMDRVGDTAENIVEKPLKDLNLMKDKVPQQLLDVMERPYALDGIKTCKDFKAKITRLTELLGPDVDSAEAQQKGGPTASEQVLGGVESVAGSLIPFTGLIRKVSGAEAAQKRAQAAVFAGSVRRAYLKGTARAKGCKV